MCIPGLFIQLHLCEEQQHTSAISAVKSGTVSCCLSNILFLSSRMMGRNGPWEDVGSLTRAFKKQEKVITKRGMKPCRFLTRTAFNLKG